MKPDDPSLKGDATSARGTPLAVDLLRDRRARAMWVVFLGGPLLWIFHFMFVYLVAEAGCTGGGPGLELFDPPVPRTVTLVVTAMAATACLPMAAWGLRRWREATHRSDGGTGDDGDDGDDGDHAGAAGAAASGNTLPFAGFLLSSFSFVAIVFVGLPAAFLPAC